MNPWAAWRGAVAFLTRIPVGRSAIEAESIAWSPALFPLVGAGLGFLSWGVLWLASPLGICVSACFATAFAVLVTGALHEDGLADSADGLLGAVSRDRALEIMKDSRIGTYGAAALSLVLFARVALLSEVGSTSPIPYVLSGSLARLGPVWLMTHVPHAAPTTAKHGDFLGIHRSRAWVASGVMTLACVGLLWRVPGLAEQLAGVWLASITVTLCVWHLGRRRLGGITGDLLGACEQLGEVVILAVFAARN